MRRGVPIVFLATLLLGGTTQARPLPPVQQFAARCEYAILPNFVIPLKSIAKRSDLSYSTSEPDASGMATLATLERPDLRILTRFGQPRPNDVEVAEFGLSPTRLDDSAFGRIVALFRFCDRTH